MHIHNTDGGKSRQTLDLCVDDLSALLSISSVNSHCSPTARLWKLLLRLLHISTYLQNIRMISLKRKASAEVDNPRRDGPERPPSDHTSSLAVNKPADLPPVPDDAEILSGAPNIHGPTSEFSEDIERRVTNYLEGSRSFRCSFYSALLRKSSGY